MFTPHPFLFRASPEKLRDYSEHQAATCARRDLICRREKLAAVCVLTARLPSAQTTFRTPSTARTTASGTFFLRCPSPPCLPSARPLLTAFLRCLFSQGHAEQPDPAQPAGLADDRRLALQTHRGRVRRVGRVRRRRPSTRVASAPAAPAHARPPRARRMHFDVRLLQRVPYEGALSPTAAASVAFAHPPAPSAQVSPACRRPCAVGTVSASFGAPPRLAVRFGHPPAAARLAHRRLRPSRSQPWHWHGELALVDAPPPPPRPRPRSRVLAPRRR